MVNGDFNHKLQRAFKLLPGGFSHQYDSQGLAVVIEIAKHMKDPIVEVHGRRGQALRERLMHAVRTIPNHTLQSIEEGKQGLRFEIDHESVISVVHTPNTSRTPVNCY